LTYFIYFSLIGEVIIATFALIYFFLPGTIAKWASIFFFISELPFLAANQIIIIISDSGGVIYTTFGVPLLFLTPLLYLFATATFISIQNLFDSTNRDFFGRAPFNSNRRFTRRR
jgi:hypothetical protein